MVVFVAKQAVDSTDLQDFHFSWKNGSGRITARKNGELWYKITDIKLAENKFVKLIKDGDIQKLFKNDDSFTGSDFEDNLVARGGNDVAKGKGGNDTIDGNDGDDKLYGGGKDDFIGGDKGDDLVSGGSGDNRLSGGRGNDHFLFDAPLTGGNAPFKQGNISFIDDFNFYGSDKILLDRSVFDHIGPKGKLSADSFSVYESGKTYSDHSLIYDKEQGDIWFTKGGTIIDAVKFAKILPDQELTHKDFLIV